MSKHGEVIELHSYTLIFHLQCFELGLFPTKILLIFQGKPSHLYINTRQALCMILFILSTPLLC